VVPTGTSAWWYSSLLEGTNRLETVGEIQSPETLLDGIDALGPALETLAAGQQVFVRSGACG